MVMVVWELLCGVVMVMVLRDLLCGVVLGQWWYWNEERSNRGC